MTTTENIYSQILEEPSKGYNKWERKWHQRNPGAAEDEVLLMSRSYAPVGFASEGKHLNYKSLLPWDQEGGQQGVPLPLLSLIVINTCFSIKMWQST